MGFSWAESSKALKTHTNMEEAIESLFNEGGGKAFPEVGLFAQQGYLDIEASFNLCSFRWRHRKYRPSSRAGGRRQQRERRMDNSTIQPAESTADRRARESEPRYFIIHPSFWKRCQTVSSPWRTPLDPLSPLEFTGIILGFKCFFFSLSDSTWRKLFSVWVGVLAPSVTYMMLHQLFSRWRVCGSFELQIQKAAVLLLPSSSSLSPFLFFRVRAGTIYSIKMLLEQQCAFVNYTKEEDCDRAIQCFNVRTHEADEGV